jgi:predicted  nucleic acid-binding Zn-ribbon protein
MSVSNDPKLLESILQDTQDTYAQLLVLIEQSVQSDPETQASQAMAFEAQIDDLMQQADAQLTVLRKQIEPWSERRKAYPPELAAKVEKFLSLLEKGLTGIKSQVDHRVADLEERREEIQKSLAEISQQRKGLQGYKSKGTGSKLLNKKA